MCWTAVVLAAFANFVSAWAWSSLTRNWWVGGLKRDGNPSFVGTPEQNEERMKGVHSRAMGVSFAISLVKVTVLKALLEQLPAAWSAPCEAMKLSLVLWLGYTFTTFHHTVWAQRSRAVLFADLGMEFVGSVVVGYTLAYFSK